MAFGKNKEDGRLTWRGKTLTWKGRAVTWRAADDAPPADAPSTDTPRSRGPPRSD